MNLERLRADWKTDADLRLMAFETVEELAEHLVKCHRQLAQPGAGPFGYLYRQQQRRVRELQEELKNERKRSPGRR